MSLLQKIAALFSGGSAGPCKPGKQGPRLYLLDTRRLSGGGSRSPSPRDQLEIIRRVGVLVKNEGLTLYAIFEGEPLRKVHNGGELDGVRIYFAEGSAAVATEVQRLAKENRNRYEVVVITSNPDLDKFIRNGYGTTIHTSTFKRWADGAGSGGNGGGGEDRNRRSRNRRPNRSSGRSSERSSERDRKPRSSESRERKPRESNSNGGGVADLIDIVE